MIAFFRSLTGYGVWLCGLALITGLPLAYGQMIPSLPETGAGASGWQKLLGGATKATVPPAEAVFEGPVNPDEYIVGPGDRLQIVFWQPTYMEYPCTVNGEGDLILPYVSVIPLGGLTLTEARSKIEAEVARALRVGRVTVSLVEPRKLRVHVTGLVTSPGTFIAPATYRVADALDMAGGLKRELTYTGADTMSVPAGSERRIELRDSEGRVTGRADLLLFLKGGVTSANPLLRDGMTIYVPYPDLSSRRIGVFGAVGEGGLFEYADGDCVGDVLALAGGLSSAADSARVLIVGEGERNISLDLRSPQRDSALATALLPGDRVCVQGVADTSRLGTVVLKGEVARPGGYAIVVGETTLRQVLQDAGGLLPNAAVNSARLVRNAPPDLAEPERYRLLTAAIAPPRAVTALQFDNELAAAYSRWDWSTVVLDLSEAAAGEGDDLKLADGDVLVVPRSPLGVRVLGAVNQSGEVDWAPGESLAYYLKKAGGVNRSGWKGRTMVIRARDGSPVRYQSGLSIDPGDVIFVPAKPVTTNWTMVKDIVAVTAQVATLALVVQNIGK